MQDKLDDSEKDKIRYKKERKQAEEDTQKEYKRYKDLLSLREKEIESLKIDMRRLQRANDEIKHHLDYIEKENREYKVKSSGGINKSNSNALDDLSYLQQFESHTTDNRRPNPGSTSQ